MDNKTFLAIMAGDKKAQAGTIRLVLLKSIGEAYVTGDYPQELLEKTLTEWRA
jgi:3-dehydroquinate synthase